MGRRLTAEEKQNRIRQEKKARNAKIRDMYESGKYSQRSLGKKVGLSKSQINRILY